jgi:hypothetical protein
MSTYAEVVKQLPMPTQEQIREFAEFVPGAHSWYKHLDIDPPSPFVFYLDPNAGRAMVHVSDDVVTFVDNTGESEKFHYTWQTTEAYRRRFGFWNYEAPYGRSFQFQSDDGVVDTAGTGLLILSPEGEWLPISERLARAGTSQLSALMWYPSRRPEPIGLALIEQEMRIACVLRVSVPSGRATYEVEARDWLKHLLPALPADMVEALDPLFALWTESAYQRELAETHRAHDEYRRAEAGNPRRELPSTADPGFVLYLQAKEKWEITASRRRERVLLAPLIAAFDRERQRQVDAMVRAMNQFLEMLQAAGVAAGLSH